MATRRSRFSRSRPPRRFSPSRVCRPISCCSRPGLGPARADDACCAPSGGDRDHAVSLDHQAFLGDTLAAIAGEKAGILKPGVPAVIGPQPAEAEAVIEPAPPRSARRSTGGGANGGATLIAPLLAQRVPPSPALRERVPSAARRVRARPACATMARLAARPAAALTAGRAPDRQCRDRAGLPRTSRRVLTAGRCDRGGSAPDRLAGAVAAPDARPPRRNPAARMGIMARWWPQPGAGEVLADAAAKWRDRPLYLVVGMLNTKDAAGFLAPLAPLCARAVRADHSRRGERPAGLPHRGNGTRVGIAAEETGSVGAALRAIVAREDDAARGC